MKRGNFTLIELLIVIGIIAILAGILLPVLSGATKRADMTKAKAEITTLMNAIKQFESTYGTLPIPAAYLPASSGRDEYRELDSHLSEDKQDDGDEYEDLIRILQGENPVHNTFGSSNFNPNTRRTRFLDVVGNEPGEFKDPWDRNYKILMDTDYDGMIGTSGNSRIRRGYRNNSVIYFELPLYYSVIIYSKGANASDNSVRAIHNDNVYSFPVVWDRKEQEYNITK